MSDQLRFLRMLQLPATKEANTIYLVGKADQSLEIYATGNTPTVIKSAIPVKAGDPEPGAWTGLAQTATDVSLTNVNQVILLTGVSTTCSLPSPSLLAPGTGFLLINHRLRDIYLQLVSDATSKFVSHQVKNDTLKLKNEESIRVVARPGDADAGEPTTVYEVVGGSVFYRDERIWRDVASQRVFNATYTNTTGLPIIVRVTRQRTSDGSWAFLMATVDGVDLEGQGNALAAGTQEQCLIEFTVPPERTYSLKTYGGSWNTATRQWVEYSL